MPSVFDGLQRALSVFFVVLLVAVHPGGALRVHTAARFSAPTLMSTKANARRKHLRKWAGHTEESRWKRLFGTIQQKLEDNPEWLETVDGTVVAGVMELVRFPNASGLKSIGGNLYLETEASGPPEIGAAGQNGFGTIKQGYLEMSNVNVVEEMVNMIIAQRAYEINSKSIQTSDEMLSRINQLKR